MDSKNEVLSKVWMLRYTAMRKVAPPVVDMAGWGQEQKNHLFAILFLCDTLPP